MSLDEKLQKLSVLSSFNTSMTKVSLDLYQNGHIDLGDQVEKILIHLSVGIEELTHKTLEEWVVMSKNYVSEAEPLLSQVKDSLYEIDKNLNDTKKVAKSVSKIDKAIQTILKQIT